MAIRPIEYTVGKYGILPNTEQRGGLQGEEGVTELIFTLDNDLYLALLAEKRNTDTLIYRFDCIDSIGGSVRVEPKELTSESVSIKLGENLTRNGGKVTIYLVITRYNSEDKTETNLLSYPAKIRLENVPEMGNDNGSSVESISTLADIAKKSAERAETAAETAVNAQGKTEQAKAAIEGDTTVIFDGNGTFGAADVSFAVDDILNTESANAIANSVVAGKFNSVDETIANIINGLSTQIMSAMYPVGSVFISSIATSPATIYGGIWQRITGRYIYALADGEDVQGGEAQHSLTIAEMPPHTHGTFTPAAVRASYQGDDWTKQPINPDSYTRETTSTGGGQPFDIKPLYQGYYVWERIG